MTHVALSLGSNIEKERNIRHAIRSIKEIYGELEISPVYETSSVGFEGPTFFNLACGFYTDETATNIRENLQQIESSAGRVRGPKLFSSRVLDIDIVLFGNQNLRPAGHNIPRDEIEKYAYVLKPLADLYPDLVHPTTAISIHQMWLEFDTEGQTLSRVDFDFKL